MGGTNSSTRGASPPDPAGRRRRASIAANARRLGLLLALASAPLALSGCRVSEDDVRRWESTQRGPYKLVAVITHDKYPLELRTEAALSLIRMPPRGGVRQGIKFLVDKYRDEEGEEREGALAQVPEETRRQILGRLTPVLVEQLAAPPPARTPDGRLPPDPSIPYKDAAFALLVHEPPLVSDDETKASLRSALVTWAQTGFEDRVENGAQQYGLEQMMSVLGPESVRVLPSLVDEDTVHLDRIASLVKDVGSDASKLEMSKALVALASKYTSKAWLDAQTKIVKEHNAKNGVKADDAQVAAQVDKILERRLTEEVFPAMKRVAGAPAVEYLLTYASSAEMPAARRTMALAALESNLDKHSESQLERVFALAKDEGAPDTVRDGAFRRIGEFPAERIVPKLYTLGDTGRWKVRWVAYETILSTMALRDLPGFMGHLPKTASAKMGMTEPLSYAAVVRDKMDGEPKAKLDAMLPYLGSRDLGPKLVALGYFWTGKKADVHLVQPLANDASPLPRCEQADECSWECDVPKAGAPGESEPRQLETVGDFVTLCLVPSMAK